MYDDSSSVQRAAGAPFDPVHPDRLHRIAEELEARARRVFPALPADELSSFAYSLAGHRLQEEERRARAR